MALRLGIACVAVLGLAACNNPPRIMLMDGSGSDGGSTVDGGARTDSGSAATCGSVTLADNLPPLPTGCLPRCSSATLTAVMGCTTGACQQMAVMADTTPAATVAVNAMNQMINCSNCFNWQLNSCASTSCPAEFNAAIGCDDTMDADMCSGEEMALTTCIMTNQAAFDMCGGMRAGACFAAGGGGFFPGTIRPDLTLHVEMSSVIDAVREARRFAH